VIETLTTGQMTLSGTNSPPAEVLTSVCWRTISPRECHLPSSLCFYHWVDTSAGGLLVPESVICPVVSVSGKMTLFGTNSPPAEVLTSDRNTDYWADDTLWD
jgi:hypothetical protein